MRTTQQFSITLPNQMADVVKAKVAAGELIPAPSQSAPYLA